MSDERAKLLDKLKKLAAHAKSAAAIDSEAEAQAFAARLHELMARHNVEMSELEYLKKDETDPMTVATPAPGLIPLKKKRSYWSEKLAQCVACMSYCEVAVHPPYNIVGFIGRTSSATTACETYVYLYNMADTIATKEYVMYFYECRDRGDVSRARGFRGSFLLGFVTRLVGRIKEKEDELKKMWEGDGKALVRLTDARTEAHEFANAISRSITTGPSAKLENAEGFLEGQRFAAKIKLPGEAERLPSGRR